MNEAKGLIRPSFGYSAQTKTAPEGAVSVDNVFMITLISFFSIFRLNQSDQNQTATLLPEPVPDDLDTVLSELWCGHIGETKEAYKVIARCGGVELK